MPSFALGDSTPTPVPVGDLSYYGDMRVLLKTRTLDWAEAAPGYSVVATSPSFVYDPSDVTIDDVALGLVDSTDGPIGWVLDNRSIADVVDPTTGTTDLWFELYADDVVLTSHDDGSMSPVLIGGVLCYHAIDGLLVWRTRFSEVVSLEPGDAILLDWRPNTGG